MEVQEVFVPFDDGVSVCSEDARVPLQPRYDNESKKYSEM